LFGVTTEAVDLSPSEATGLQPKTGEPAEPAPPALAPLGRGFWALFAAFFVANLGSGITSVAFPWLTTSLTRDPLLVAGIPVAAELPWLLFSLPVGALLDRYELRRIVMLTHLARAVLVGLVAVAIATGTVTVVMLYLFAFAVGTLTVANENATQTLLPRVVPSSALERANGHLVLADTTGGVFIGPLLGGALLAVSLSLPFALDAGLYLVAAVLILFVAVRPRKALPGNALPGNATTGDGPRASLRAEIAEGVRYFWRTRALRDLGLFLGFLNLASAIVMATQVLYAQEILDVGPTAYGLLFAAGAVGAGVGASLAARAEERLGARRVLLVTLTGSALLTAVIGLTSNPFVVGLAIGFSALLAVMWNVVTVSYRQRIVPEELLGRVNSIYRLLSWGPLPLGSLAGGAIVIVGAATVDREFGLRLPLAVAAVMTLVLLLVALPLRTGVWSRERRVTENRAFGFRRRWVLLSLLAVNSVVTVVGLVLIAADAGLTADAALFDGIGVVHEAGEMYGPAVRDGQVWRPVTAMFVHYGVLHLLANMVMLAIAAWRYEPLLGSVRFLALYFACGVGASVATYVASYDVRTAGASGATYGIFAAFLVTCLWKRRNPTVALVLLAFAVVANFAVPGMAMVAHGTGVAIGVVLATAYALHDRAGDRSGE
jgi:membrane associated rhomboid family serine protease